MSGADKKRQKTVPEWEKNVQLCTKALKIIMKNPAAGAFLIPVDWKALKLPTYPKIVKTPMDLGTVQQKLESARYNKVEDFIGDVEQVWKNAKLFNLEGSDIYEVATLLDEEFVSKLEVTTGALREPGSGGGPSRGGGGGGGDSLSGDKLAQCKAALRELRKHKDAAAFLEPVDWKALGIKDYPTIIKRPMDLGTVMKRLESNQYASILDVAADVDLVWSNAMTYNQDESYIYQVAADLKAFADRKMAPLVAAAREAGDVPQELTFEMKRQLNENAALLSSKDLYGMVGIVEDSCKRAIDQSSPQEVEIDIDSLDLQVGADPHPSYSPPRLACLPARPERCPCHRLARHTDLPQGGEVRARAKAAAARWWSTRR